ncbi:MAG: hydantoinase B/oxoprolinase family protein [Ramlibacter sp.]
MSHALAMQGGEFERTVATVEAAGGGPAPAAPVAAAGSEDSFCGRLETLADTMQASLVSNAVSSVVREAMDCAAAIFLPDGRMAAQARSLPLLLGSLSPAVAGLLETFPAHRMREGDGYLSNDPWSGGTHLPDFVLLRPVFAGGHVQALVACVLHHQDVGGVTPGSVPTDATSIHQEGLRIPPVQLMHGGTADGQLMQLLMANSRRPDNLRGDLQAQWGALERGAGDLAALIAQQAGGFAAACETAIAASEAATRAALAAAPDGDYRFLDALDGDGINAGPVAVEVRLRKRGDQLTVDLTGCALQATGPVNASRGAVWAAVSYFARMLAPQAASNHGCTAPLRLISTPGSVVDPTFPAAVNARTNLVKLLANALLGAWAQARPGQSAAPHAAVAVVLSLAGTRADGGAWLYTEIIASAAGGAPWGPGGSGVSTDVGNARNTPAEVIEAQAPLRVERVALRSGSGGTGQHAGGNGVVRAYRLLEGEGSISYRGERHTTQAQGAAGGSPGACGSARIERSDGTVQALPAKARASWSAGDRLVIETAGAGGWGQPPSPGAQFA